ncbi:hypothetical protein [Candidatus Protochlamydia phocaeensis]|uniref:hypothetical protein n=1 Tax=Candidatus Protochlamydia phocaeensis TaxID=1414722 RepID=UPI000838B629|nr:hypothetical protein [Candidatus Protochlamydia phocaeensis]
MLNSISHADISKEFVIADFSGPEQMPWYENEGVKNCAKTLIDYGQYLSYARYAKYVPGAPSILSNKAVHFVGDVCTVVHSGLDIKSKMDTVLSDQASADVKAQKMVQIAQLALKVANTQLVDYLPESASNTLKWANSACEVARVGVACKSKVGDVMDGKESGLAHTRNKVEAALLAATAAKSALDLVGTDAFDSIKATLSFGKGVLTVAKVGVGTAQFFAGLAKNLA